MNPPVIAMPIINSIDELMSMPLPTCAIRPEIEFTKINKALMPAVCRIVAQRVNTKIGDNRMPPPIPKSPDKNHSMLPVSNK